VTNPAPGEWKKTVIKYSEKGVNIGRFVRQKQCEEKNRGEYRLRLQGKRGGLNKKADDRVEYKLESKGGQVNFFSIPKFLDPFRCCKKF
jgi:hypothetical protein